MLTTNVTGHAALFAERIAFQDWRTAVVIGFWMFLFLAGAFLTGIVLSFSGENKCFFHLIPVIIEILILLTCALVGFKLRVPLTNFKEVFAGSLLFAMGLENALVTVVSGSFLSPVLILLLVLAYNILRIKAKRYYRAGLRMVKTHSRSH